MLDQADVAAAALAPILPPATYQYVMMSRKHRMATTGLLLKDPQRSDMCARVGTAGSLRMDAVAAASTPNLAPLAMATHMAILSTILLQPLSPSCPLQQKAPARTGISSCQDFTLAVAAPPLCQRMGSPAGCLAAGARGPAPVGITDTLHLQQCQALLTPSWPNCKDRCYNMDPSPATCSSTCKLERKPTHVVPPQRLTLCYVAALRCSPLTSC